MTPEGKVKQAVKNQLAKYRPHIWTHWPVQTGYGAPTLDCVGSRHGHSFAIETKAPGKRLTPRQELTIREMVEGGVAVFVIGEQEVYGDFRYSGQESLEQWLIDKKQLSTGPILGSLYRFTTV